MWLNILYVLVMCLAAVTSEYKYDTKWFKVPLDHFGFQRNETFQIKYLVNDDHWDRRKGPIFFYTGNEGQIEQFAKYTGFVWEIAEQFGAKIVFAEHRYYGASMPFGNNSLDNEHIGFLTSSQALADYADLVNELQGGAMKPQYPVIAFGGSYGGMLAAYFRIKYPHLVTGAIAASAPVHMFNGMVPCGVFNRIVTSSFKLATRTCADNIKNSWSVISKYLDADEQPQDFFTYLEKRGSPKGIRNGQYLHFLNISTDRLINRNFTSTTNTTEWLQKTWKLCDPIKGPADVESLIDFLQDMYGTLAMVNYPYESQFLVPLPAYPVRVVCQYLNTTLTGQKLLEGIGKVLDVYTNYDKKSKCVDYKSDSYGNLDANGWGYQACTEMVMPMCSEDPDMFETSPWNYTSYAEDCHKKYNVYPRLDAARIQYGGENLQAASNIVFSNGLLDPWAGGGILNSISESVVSMVMVDAAHHLDMMPQNPNDPEVIKEARNIHKQHIDKWIKEFTS